MEIPLDWRDDPFVLVERDILPFLSVMPRLLCARALGQPDPRLEADWRDAATRAQHLLATAAGDHLDKAGFPLDPDDRAFSEGLARSLSDFCKAIETSEATDTQAVAGHLALFSDQIDPGIATFLESVRRTFVGGVLRQQMKRAACNDQALGRLSDVSRKIYLISINASVEAARAGDAGLGFAVIADEIRALAQSAQGSLNEIKQGQDAPDAAPIDDTGAACNLASA